jgi:hypothetical protein
MNCTLADLSLTKQNVTFSVVTSVDPQKFHHLVRPYPTLVGQVMPFYSTAALPLDLAAAGTTGA